MKVLGISGKRRDAAAALVVDGRVVAAASEDCFKRLRGIGYAHQGGFPRSAVESSLATAGVLLSAIDALAVVDEDMSDGGGVTGEDPILRAVAGGRSIHAIDPVHADAMQAAMSHAGDAAVLVCSTEPSGISSFIHRGHQLQPDERFPGGQHLACAARMLALALGMPEGDPFRLLDRLSVGAEPAFQDAMADAIHLTEDGTLAVDQDGLRSVVASSGDETLADGLSFNVRVQQARRALAATFTCRVAEILHAAATRAQSRSGLHSVVHGGAVVANGRLATEMRRLSGNDLRTAAVPEARGRAMGAAAAASGPGVASIDHLSLGSSFSESDIKRTLDNCRLDYVYEPDWPRLLDRTSAILSKGKIVAWFQDAAGFGPGSTGTRCVLCDPSSRYARHNVNEYFKQVPVDEPLPIVLAPSAAADCLVEAVPAPFTRLDAAVKSEWRERLSGALDWRQSVRVHTPGPQDAPALVELLECHFRRTGVPALIEADLCAAGDPVACTPRQAVQTLYSSTIDALVIASFVLMKDYWLLRSNVD